MEQHLTEREIKVAALEAKLAAADKDAMSRLGTAFDNVELDAMKKTTKPQVVTEEAISQMLDARMAKMAADNATHFNKLEEMLNARLPTGQQTPLIQQPRQHTPAAASFSAHRSSTSETEPGRKRPRVDTGAVCQSLPMDLQLHC